MADINILNKLHDDKTSKYIELDDLCKAAYQYGKQMGGAIVTNTSKQTNDSQLLTVYASTQRYPDTNTDINKNIRYCVLHQIRNNNCGDNIICIAFDDIDPLCEQLQNIKEEYETAKMEYDALLKKVDPVEIKTYEED
jgi:hypothetical protein